jgi:hypothetical protein
VPSANRPRPHRTQHHPTHTYSHHVAPRCPSTCLSQTERSADPVLRCRYGTGGSGSQSRRHLQDPCHLQETPPRTARSTIPAIADVAPCKPVAAGRRWRRHKKVQYPGAAGAGSWFRRRSGRHASGEPFWPTKSAGGQARWVGPWNALCALRCGARHRFAPADFGLLRECVQAVLTSCTHLPDLGVKHGQREWARMCIRPGQRWCAARDLNPEPAD